MQKALQVSNGIKFLEMIEQIKKILNNLKKTNYGKKIHDNLIMNYGEYFSSYNQKGMKNRNSAAKNSSKKEKIVINQNSSVCHK